MASLLQWGKHDVALIKIILFIHTAINICQSWHVRRSQSFSNETVTPGRSRESHLKELKLLIIFYERVDHTVTLSELHILLYTIDQW
jgi:hypothetical protein